MHNIGLKIRYTTMSIISIATISLLVIILSFVIIVACLVIFFGFNMIYINLKTLVPWARAPMSGLNNILRELNLPTGSLVYDLGCGDGRFLFLAEAVGLKAVGYELALYPYLKARVNKFLKGSQVVIENKDFFKQDLSSADAIFIFLTASVMKKIGKKLKNHLKSKTIVVSYGFEIPDWKIVKVLDTKPSKTYIY